MLFPLVRSVMRPSMRIAEAGCERSRQKVTAAVAEVSELLADGRTYLVGERFSAADPTFAALAAPIVGVSGYGGDLPADDTSAGATGALAAVAKDPRRRARAPHVPAPPLKKAA